MSLASVRRRKPPSPTTLLRSMGPTFAATVRIWWFMRALYVRRDGWSVREAADELEVHPKTIHRYVRLLALVHTDGEGEPIVCIERRGRAAHVILKKRLLPFELDAR